MNETKNKNDEFLYSIWNFFAASLSEKTRKNYYNVIKAYIKITGHSPLELTESDTEKYFNDLTEKIQSKRICSWMFPRSNRPRSGAAWLGTGKIADHDTAGNGSQ